MTTVTIKLTPDEYTVLKEALNNARFSMLMRGTDALLNNSISMYEYYDEKRQAIAELEATL